MKINHMSTGEEYYTLIGKKDIEGIMRFLHSEVELLGPFAHLKGREPVVLATENFMKSFKTLRILSKFGNEDQAMIVYETDIPGIADQFPGASLLNFRDGLIIRIQLFYDGSRFMEKSKEIFSAND